MKKVLAISGGVDSMFLLSKYKDEENVVVAHFNHGTRASAKDDAEFVKRKAKEYGLPFFLGEAKLGNNASEAEARAARYNFLEKVASEVGGVIYTAHHLNDLYESVAINLLRGTGWRGLTPFERKDIMRPLLFLPKRNIHRLAAESGIEFRQDPTNNESSYLRNRLREKTDSVSEEDLLKLLELYNRQITLRKEAEEILDNIIPKDGKYFRSWFDNMDDAVALEILRAGLNATGTSATRPQILDFLQAIRTSKAHKKFNLPNDRLVTIYKDFFVL